MKKLLILLTLLCATITANASLITIDIEDKTYDMNDMLTADIYISKLENIFGVQELVSAFLFDLTFNETLLDFDKVTFGNMLDVDTFFGTESSKVSSFSTGQPIEVSETSFAFSDDLFAAQGGFPKFLLAKINFTVKGNGSAAFSLEKVNVFDDFALPHGFVSIQDANVTLGNQVSVPEPSSIIIFSLALLVLISVKRKYEANALISK